MSVTDSITITQATNKVTVTAQGSVGLNAGGQIDGNLEVTGTVAVGGNQLGKDVRFWGETANKYFLWDASQNKLIITGDLAVDGVTTTIDSEHLVVSDPIVTLGGSSVPTSADSKDRGVEHFYYDTSAGAGKRGFFGYSNADNAYKFLTDCPDPSGAEIFTGTAATLLAGTVKASTIGTASGNLTLAPAGTHISFAGKRLYGSNVALGYRLNAVSATWVALGLGIDSPSASLSRTAAGTIALGDGTQNDASGTLLAGKVGLNTSAPSGKLTSYVSATRQINLHDGSSGGDFSVVCDNNSTPVAHIKGTGTADLLNVFDNTTEVFTILDGGNVGINQAVPTAPLHINDDESTGSGILVTGGGGGGPLATFTRDVGSHTGTVAVSSSSGFPQIQFATNNTFAIGVNNTSFEIADNTHLGSGARFTIDSSGNCGIGVTAPSTKVHILNVTTNDPHIRLSDPNSTSTNDATGYLEVYHGNTTGRAGYFGMITNAEMAMATTTSSGNLSLYTGSNVKAVTIDNSQNVGIGENSPATALSVKRDSGSVISEVAHFVGGGSTDDKTQITVGGNTSSALVSFGFRNTGSGFGYIANASDAEVLTIDGGNSRVGIGVAAPAQALHVKASTQAFIRVESNGSDTAGIELNSSGTVQQALQLDSANNLILRNTAGTHSGDIYLDYEDSVFFRAGGATTALTILNSGNVSIGTTVPSDFAGIAADDLVIKGAGDTGITIATGNTTKECNINFSDGSGADSYRGTIQYKHVDDSMRFYAAAVERLRLESGGTVRIFGNLDVDGSTTVIDSTVVSIKDPILTLGGDTAPSSDDNKDRGIEFRYYDGSAKIGFMGWDDSAGGFTLLKDATNSSEVFSGTAADLATGAISAGGHINLNDNQLQNVGVLQGTASGGLLLKHGDGNFAIVGSTNGKVDIRHAGSVKLETTSTGIEVTGGIVASDDVAVDTDTFFVDVSTDRVGINTSTPSFDFDIHGDARIIDNKILRFGNGGDLQIYHDETHSWITNYTGNLYLTNQNNGADIRLLSDDGSGGVATYLTIDGGLGFTTLQKKLRAEDDVKIEAGSSGDLQLQHTSDNSYIENTKGHLYVNNNEAAKNLYLRNHDGSSVSAFLTLSAGFGYTLADKDIRFGDSVKARFGNGSDLQIHHNGTDSRIDNTVGDLLLVNYANGKNIGLYSDDGSGGVTSYITVDGGNERVTVSKNLYTGNLYPTGQLSLDGDIFVQDSHTINVGSGGDMTLKHDGSNSRLNNSTGNLYVSNTATDKDVIFQANNTSGGSEEYARFDGSAQTVHFSKPVNQAVGTIDPVSNGDLTFTAVSDTSLKIKYKGSDGSIRSTTLTLS